MNNNINYNDKVEMMLSMYTKLVNEIKNLALDIEELEQNYTGLTSIGYTEKTGATYKINSVVENEVTNKENKIEYLQRLKRSKEIQVEKIETRSWKTIYRGPLLIHACKKVEHDICRLHPFTDVLLKHDIVFKNQMPTGLIIAKCNLIDCIKVAGWELDTSLRVVSATLGHGQLITGNEYEFGDYTPERYAWILENIEMLKEPIPDKGQLSLWEYDLKI